MKITSKTPKFKGYRTLRSTDIIRMGDRLTYYAASKSWKKFGPASMIGASPNGTCRPGRTVEKARAASGMAKHLWLFRAIASKPAKKPAAKPSAFAAVWLGRPRDLKPEGRYARLAAKVPVPEGYKVVPVGTTIKASHFFWRNQVGPWTSYSSPDIDCGCSVGLKVLDNQFPVIARKPVKKPSKKDV